MTDTKAPLIDVHTTGRYGDARRNRMYGYRSTPLLGRINTVAADTCKSIRRIMPRYSRRTITIACDALIVLFAIVFILQNVGYLFALDDVPAGKKLEIRLQWKLEAATHAEEVATWQRERTEHENEAAAWEKKREEWAQERKEWAREREEVEHRRKEIEKARMGVHWSEPWLSGGGTCKAFGTRAYSAHLLDIPKDLDWLEVCSDMPIKFHGRWVSKPNWCERGSHGEVWATWHINFDEPECNFYWDSIRPLGCINGHMRYEATLKNLHHGDDWDTMCQTTPAIVNGIYFDHPTVCQDRNGRTGIWDLPQTC